MTSRSDFHNLHTRTIIDDGCLPLRRFRFWGPLHCSHSLNYDNALSHTVTCCSSAPPCCVFSACCVGAQRLRTAKRYNNWQHELCVTQVAMQLNSNSNTRQAGFSMRSSLMSHHMVHILNSNLSFALSFGFSISDDIAFASVSALLQTTRPISLLCLKLNSTHKAHANF